MYTSGKLIKEIAFSSLLVLTRQTANQCSASRSMLQLILRDMCLRTFDLLSFSLMAIHCILEKQMTSHCCVLAQWLTEMSFYAASLQRKVPQAAGQTLKVKCSKSEWTVWFLFQFPSSKTDLEPCSKMIIQVFQQCKPNTVFSLICRLQDESKLLQHSNGQGKVTWCLREAVQWLQHAGISSMACRAHANQTD